MNEPQRVPDPSPPDPDAADVPDRAPGQAEPSQPVGSLPMLAICLVIGVTAGVLTTIVVKLAFRTVM